MSLGWIASVLSVVALAVAWWAVRRLRVGSTLSALGAGILALGLGAVGGLCLGLAAAFTPLDTEAEETTVGTVELGRMEAGIYVAKLELDRVGPRSYRLAGDHWQLDVRFLCWRLPAGLVGPDCFFQLDRISGLYAEPSDLAHAELTAYGLPDALGRLVWSIVGEAGRRLSWMDTEYGTAAYMPMTDGARYRVSVTEKGLVARPDNPAARAAAGFR